MLSFTVDNYEAYGYRDFLVGDVRYSLYIYVPADGAKMFRIVRMSADGDNTPVIAAKVEHGPVQTLARQDENGSWVLDDPPDYDLQYLLCSQYSPSTGEWVGTQHSRRNLLDNGYFPDPVNQQEQTEYHGAVYGIDRWKGSGAHVRCTLESDGLTVGRIPGNTTTGTRNMVQIVDDFEALAGRTVTVSALVSRATTIAEIFLFGATIASVFGSEIGTYSGKPFLLTKTVTLPEDIDGLQIQLRAPSGAADTSATFVAAKLELGDRQTLARQDENGNWVLNDPPPDKSLELLKCQRYLYIVKAASSVYDLTFPAYVSANNTSCIAAVPIPTPMRAAPAVSFSADSRLAIRCVTGHPAFSDESNQINPSDVLATAHYTPENAQIGLRLTFGENTFDTNNTPASVALYYGSMILDANL